MEKPIRIHFRTLKKVEKHAKRNLRRISNFNPNLLMVRNSQKIFLHFFNFNFFHRFRLAGLKFEKIIFCIFHFSFFSDTKVGEK